MLLGFTIFLSAFLLFQVQLIVAKHLLPWFGGAPAVWTTCQLFFQVSLLAGYAYAHLLAGVRSLRRQGRIHLTLLFTALFALAALPVWSGSILLAPEQLRPNGTEQPAAWLLLLLASTVGLPFFLLSATGPLLQRWHSHMTDSLHRTYRLYALSNAGSLLGLLTYPFGFERLLDVSSQAKSWTALFVVFASTCCAVAWREMRLGGSMLPTSQFSRLTPGQTAENVSSVLEARRPWLWFLLSFSSSAMFLATSNQLSLEVAAVPLIWVLPLGIYLLTFIVCFDRLRWYSTRWYWIGAAAATVGILPVSLFPGSLDIPHQILAYSVFLTLFCMVCHGELARLRPGSSKLTQFYLFIAVGGASGGTYIGLGAPAVFPDVWEFNVTVLVGWAVFALLGLADRTSLLHVGDRWQFWFATVLVCILVVHFLILGTKLHKTAWVVRYDWMVPVAGGAVLAAVVSLTLWQTRLADLVIWPRFVILCVMLSAGLVLFERVQRSEVGSVLVARNFYGVVRVQLTWTPSGIGIQKLMDGSTLHGVQVLQQEHRNRPTAYYSSSSGIAIASRHLVRETGRGDGSERRNVHFGVLGMGSGTMAAFAQPGDRVRFYEFNPTVMDIAMGPRANFTFIRDGAGEVIAVAGDGRLSLERELRENSPQEFDLLAMDAFSSDAVPVHLLTEEAFSVYAAHLRGNDSILAVNVTNRHLDLEPVVAASARRLGFHGIRIDSNGDPPVRHRSSWILLARNAKVLEHLQTTAALVRPLHAREVSFTDRYSNLFRVLK